MPIFQLLYSTALYNQWSTSIYAPWSFHYSLFLNDYDHTYYNCSKNPYYAIELNINNSNFQQVNIRPVQYIYQSIIINSYIPSAAHMRRTGSILVTLDSKIKTLIRMPVSNVIPYNFIYVHYRTKLIMFFVHYIFTFVLY